MSNIGALPYPRGEQYWAWNPDCTEQDPGTLWHMRYALCRALGVPALMVAHLKDVYLANKIYKPRDLLVKSSGITFYPEGIRQIKGGTKLYECGRITKYYPDQQTGDKPLLLQMDACIEIVAVARLASWDHLVQMLEKQIVLVGTYKDDLGGGWSSEVSLFRFQGFYYAPEREVNSRRVDQFRKQLGMDRESLTL